MRRKISGITSAAAAALAIVALLVGVGIGVAVGPMVAPPAVQTVTQTVTQTAAGGTVTVTETAAAETVTVTKTETVGGGVQTVTVTQTVGGGGLSGEITLGALLPLSGSLASYGENSKAAIEIAIQEINSWLEKAGSPVRFTVLIEDTETKPDVALTKLQSLAAKGIRLVIGPQTSAEVRNLKGFADSNKILMISQSSTAPELSIPDDFIYRFCPDDTKQGPAIARAIWEDGIRVVVPIWRGDAWGDGLHKAAKEAFEKLGGQFLEGIRYAPEEVEKKGFGAEVGLLADAVQAAVDEHGADKVGVLLIAFAESVDLLTKANDYPILSQVRWYGSDGTALLAEILQEPLAAEFAVKTKWLNPIFGEPNPKRSQLREQLVAKLGRLPDSYAYSAYDITWVLALSVLAAQSTDAEAVIKAMPGVLSFYTGAIGKIELNEGGDLAKSDYELWQIKKVDGEYEWVQVGGWDFETDSVTYTMEH